MYAPAGITTPSGNADTTADGDVLENVTTAPLGGAGEIAPDTVTDCPRVIDAGTTTVRAVIAACKPGEGIRIAGVGTMPADGITKSRIAFGGTQHVQPHRKVGAEEEFGSIDQHGINDIIFRLDAGDAYPAGFGSLIEDGGKDS